MTFCVLLSLAFVTPLCPGLNPRDRSSAEEENSEKTKVTIILLFSSVLQSCTEHVLVMIQTKANYIPQEEILRELQQIEDSLNELERTGIDLELKLRTSEESECFT